MPSKGFALLLLAVLAIAGAQDAMGAAKKGGKKRKFCTSLPKDSTAAAETVLSSGEGVPYSDFRVGLKRSGMEAAFSALCKGKVVVAPSNAALSQRFVKRGLYFADHKIPKSAVRAFKQFVPSTCVSRNQIPAAAGCDCDVYVQFELGNLDRIRCLRTGVSAAEDVGPDGVEVNRFSVLGQGYNVMNGFPVSYGMSSLDPGLTLTPIFRLNASHVRSLGTTGGQCESKFSNTNFNSVSELRRSIRVNLAVGAIFGPGAFAANAAFNMIQQTTQSTQSITSMSTAKVYLGGFGLSAGPAGLVLEQGFIDSIAPLINAAANNEYDPYAMRSLMDNYGTHYVKSVYWGGLASVIFQLTSASYSKLFELGVRLDIGAVGPMFAFALDVGYDQINTNAITETSSTYSQVLIPSGVKLAMASPDPGPSGAPNPSFIDCVAWSQGLIEAEEKGWKAPVSYSLAQITDILSFRQLFPEDMRYLLPKAQKALYDYQTTCGYSTDFDVWVDNIKRGKSSCPDAPKEEECVLGTYKTPSGYCNSCYGNGNVVGPNCNATTVIACTNALCFCQPALAADFRNKNCTPLAANPPAPPALSMFDLLKNQKKK